MRLLCNGFKNDSLQRPIQNKVFYFRRRVAALRCVQERRSPRDSVTQRTFEGNQRGAQRAVQRSKNETIQLRPLGFTRERDFCDK